LQRVRTTGAERRGGCRATNPRSCSQRAAPPRRGQGVPVDGHGTVRRRSGEPAGGWNVGSRRTLSRPPAPARVTHVRNASDPSHATPGPEDQSLPTLRHSWSRIPAPLRTAALMHQVGGPLPSSQVASVSIAACVQRLPPFSRQRVPGRVPQLRSDPPRRSRSCAQRPPSSSRALPPTVALPACRAA
jgi:hypothetical protein